MEKHTQNFFKKHIHYFSHCFSLFLRSRESTVHWLLHFVWQHIGDNFWQHCDNWSEWEKHTKLDKPVHPNDLEARSGQSSAAGRRCPVFGRWLSSQQHESLHTHRPFSIYVHYPASPGSCFSPWKYLTDRHEWERKWWFGHVLWSWRRWLHEWWGHSWEKPQNWWHQ